VSERRARDPANDALRGLAILAVVLTHTTAEWAGFGGTVRGRPLLAQVPLIAAAVVVPLLIRRLLAVPLGHRVRHVCG
jgi:peptidoglycan/LPS O-acetylase OafA/YrhL